MVTDHAVIRFLQRAMLLDVQTLAEARAQGIPLDKVQEKILTTPGLREAYRAGASRFSAEGLTYHFNETGEVVTITPGERPITAIRLAQRHRGVSDQYGAQRQTIWGRGRRDRRDRHQQEDY